jgi:hypothetical protein
MLLKKIGLWKSNNASAVKREEDAKRRYLKSGDPISSPDNVFGFLSTAQKTEDGGPNPFMREALNLVDFFESNCLAGQNSLRVCDSILNFSLLRWIHCR